MELLEIILYLGLMLFTLYAILKSSNKLPDVFYGITDYKGIPTSLLLAYYTKGHDLLNAGDGELNGMFYDVFITSTAERSVEAWSEPGTIIYSLQLPFNTQAHLVGISNKLKSTLSEVEMFLRTSNLEEVYLEGDFPNYFTLYASKGQGAHARYVFDPAAMVFVVDYCQGYFWEIAGDTLYFVVEKNHNSNNLVKSSVEFVKQIEPALKHEFKNKEARVNERRRTDKKENITNPLNCPVCGGSMIVHEDYQECPRGHGRLLRATVLSNFRGQKLATPPPLNPVNRDDTQVLICPSCHKEMQIVNYAESGINIDTCTNTNCLYRWLDAGELSKIITRH